MQRRLATHIFPFAMGLLASLISAIELAPQATGQTGDGWTTLLDDKTMGDWNKVGESNSRHEDGAVVADKKTGQDPGYLVSKASYKDFQLHVEFWASDDANSGVFLRCQDPSKLADRSCYEVNIFDQRKDPTYGTGGIVNFSEVNPMPKAGGKWNTFEITAKGRQITVLLNGQKTVELHNGLFVEGPLGLQHGGRCDQVSQGGGQAALAETEAAASPPNGNHSEDAAASVCQRAPGATGCIARQRAARQRPTASPPDIVQGAFNGRLWGGHNRTEPPFRASLAGANPRLADQLGPALHVAPDQRLGLGRRQGEQPAAGLGR